MAPDVSSDLVAQVRTIVENSGDMAGFDPERWLSVWLSEPLPALGGAKPQDYLGTEEGRDLVCRLLRQIDSGAFA